MSVAGFVENVPVESGILIDMGDLLYLSSTEAGKITNIKTSPVFQIVGRSLSQGSSTIPIDMIFSPKIVLSTGFEGQISSWNGPDAFGRYYSIIDVSSLDGTNAFDCHWFDNSDHTEIAPDEVQIFGNGNYIKVSMPVNTIVVDYIISSSSTIGGSDGGGGGGGGVTDHSLLTSLDFASSGHTGFAPTPHNNTHHSQTYITTSGVTYGALNANGDVGTGAGQLAIGNHTHSQYIDVPSGSILLFESDTVISGYILLVTRDDAVVYITKGSADGGDTGGNQKSGSTWSQPLHTHAISREPNHEHSTAPHKLTIAEIPSHRHTLGLGIYGEASGSGGYAVDIIGSGIYTSYVGGGGSHNHGNTGSGGNHNHTGTTGDSSTANTWRPYGFNYTRQQRI